MSQNVADFSVITPLSKKNKTRWRVISVLLCALLVWVSIDLFVPRRASLRTFDAREVARLETAMWRSYYDKERIALFMQLATLLRTQYRFPWLKSYVVALQAAQAAFVFKSSDSRVGAQKALPQLINFYRSIYAVGDINFEVEKAAQLELEWWIIHRERDKYLRVDLDRSLAELPAAVYQLPVEKFQEHAHLRAEAMLLRDQQAAQGGCTENDWKKIDELLQASWQSLHQAVN